MTRTLNSPPRFFNSFEEPMALYSIPERFTSPFDSALHPLSLLAVEKLQAHLETRQDWNHNFGLSTEEGMVIGKMFGVLVVKTQDDDIGYLAAFSGKLGGRNNHHGFVPPVFDGLEEGGFLNDGMVELARISDELARLEALSLEKETLEIRLLKSYRKTHSITLQNRIFDQYHFLNQKGEQKSLRTIFENAAYKNPPAGAGECAAPKLLQYAFQNRMKPLAIAEFWWGKSPKSDHWKHGSFYPACRQKCEPILAHMLSGMELEEPQN